MHNLKLTFLVCLVALALCDFAQAASLVFNEDFEAGNLATAQSLDSGASVVSDKPNTGNYCARIDYYPVKNQGLIFRPSSPPQSEVFVRYYMRIANTFHSSYLGFKILRCRTSNQSIQTEHFLSSEGWNLNGSIYKSGGFFQSWYSGFNAADLADGAWHKIEVFIKYNKAGSSDGVHRIWVDGRLIRDQTDVVFRDYSSPTDVYTMFYVPSNAGDGVHRSQAGDSIFVDDIEIWDGVPGTTSAPPPPTPPPPAPAPAAGTAAWIAVAQTGYPIWTDSAATWCVRVLVQGTSLMASGNRVQLGFQGRNTGDYQVKKVSIAQRDASGGHGDVVDATWTKVSFDGKSAATWASDPTVIPAGQEKFSDPIPFNLVSGQDYYVTFLLESPSAYLVAPTTYAECYFDNLDHASDVDWSGNGHTDQLARLHALSSISVSTLDVVDTTVPVINTFTATPANADNPGEQVTFQAQASVSDVDILIYTVNFGDGTPNGSGSQVIHTYASAGTYTATLTVSDSHGHTAYESIQVTVDDLPPTPPGGISVQ